MSEVQRPAMLRQRPLPRLATVSRVAKVTPHIVRVTLAGEALADFVMTGPASHLKVMFAEEGQDRPVLPALGPEGMPQEGQKRPLSRTYTPRRYDAKARELDIDFLLHGDGPGASWGASASVGDVVGISGGAGGPYSLDMTADWFLIGGDDSALPAIGTILEALPETARASVFIEVANAAEEQELSSPAEFEVTWLHRDGSTGPIGSLVDTAVRAVEMPKQGENRVWVGCEADLMRGLRRHLIFERGFDRSAIHTHGYWKYGATNHPDGDTGKEI